MRLEEQVRNYLVGLIFLKGNTTPEGAITAADAILAEFRLQPVSQGKVVEDGVVVPRDC